MTRTHTSSTILYLKSAGCLTLALLFACSWLHAKKDETVIPQDTRQSLLAEVEKILSDIESTPTTHREALAYPFHKEKAPEPVAQVLPEETEPEPLPVQKASDSVILRAMAEQFKPTGSLIKADRRFLVIPGGSLISEGQSLPLTVHGKEYQIIIERVQEDGYTLRLNDITLERKFNSMTGDHIKID